jgi:hypothetical protein
MFTPTVVMDCGPLPFVANSQMPPSPKTTFGSKASIQCIDGFWFTRGVYAQTLMCTESGRWLPLVGHCMGTISFQCIPLYNTTDISSEVHCPYLPSLRGKQCKMTGDRHGSKASCSCADGSIFEGNFTSYNSTCSPLGNWSPSIPDCKREYLSTSAFTDSYPRRPLLFSPPGF